MLEPEPEPPLEWRPAAGSGMIVGVGIIAALVLLGFFGITRIIGGDGVARVFWGLVTLTCLAAVGYVAYLLRGLSGLRYLLGRRGLTIEYLGMRNTVPYDAILDITYAPRDPVSQDRWERYWPGYYVSTSRRIDGLWRSWATQPAARRVRIVTQHEVVAISPQRTVLFVDELTRRCAQLSEPFGGPAPPVDIDTASDDWPRPVIEQPRHAQSGSRFAWHVLFRERLLGDQLASALIAAGLVIPFLMAGYLYSQFEGVPDSIALHYNALGDIDSFGKPRDLWLFPILAAALLIVNTALATFAELFERFISRLLLASTPLIQLLACIAMLRLMNGG